MTDDFGICQPPIVIRRKNQRVHIADGIELTLLEIAGGRVKLGVHCPPGMPVYRSEVFELLHGAREKKSLDQSGMPPSETASEPPIG